jgi:hypothetical protein
MAQVSVQPFYSGRAYYDVTSADGQKYVFVPKEFVEKGFVQNGQQFYSPGFLTPEALTTASAFTLPDDSSLTGAAKSIYQEPTKGFLWKADDFNKINYDNFSIRSYQPSNTYGLIKGYTLKDGVPYYIQEPSPGANYTLLDKDGTSTNTTVTVTRTGGGGSSLFGGLFGSLVSGLSSELAKLDPSAAISKAATDLFQPVEKAITAGVADVSKALSTDDAKKAMAIAAAYYLPGVGVELGSILKAQGLITGAAIPYATAIGTALASTGASVAQGVPFDTALTNATVNAVTSTGSQSVAGYISKLGASPEVANAVTSVGASGLATAAKGGSAADIERNMTGALAGSTITGMTGDKIAGAAVGGQITGGTTGALLGAAGAAGARDAKEGASTTTAPTTQATLTQDLTDAQVSQIQNALGISVSDATNNDVKLALGPLLAPLGGGAAIVSDSVIPLIGIFGAKAVSDTIDYFKAKNDSSGFYKWVNENMQAADDRVQNKLSLNPAGPGRGFVNPPVVTPITPSQAAISGSYGAGFSGAGGGAGAGVTAGEATAGEQEARDFLVAQKVTNPEIDFETLAREPALNEPPTDQKIIDLIQPGAASTPATVPPGTAPADRDILAFSGITQPAGSTAVTAPTQAAPVAEPVPVTPVAAPTFTPATFTPAIAPEYEQPVRGPVIDDFPFSRQPTGEPPPFVPPAVEPPPPSPPVVSEPPPDVVEPPPVVTEPPPPPPEVVVEPEPPLVDVPPAEKVVPPDKEDKPPAEKEKPLEEEDKPPGEKEDKFKPDLFIYGGKRPPRRPRTELGTTLQGPFAPSTTLGQALTGYRGAGEIEGKKTGKPRRDVWNEESLRLKDALGL